MSGLPAWREEPVSAHHDRPAFRCGEAALDEYLARYARQNHVLGAAKTYVAAAVATPSRVLGYYTLAPASLDLAETPAVLKRGLGRTSLPAFRLGRLAIDRSIQGRGLGTALLLAAGRRCITAASEVGGLALLIDAKSDRAAAWYAGFGAVAIDGKPRSLVLPLATLAQALESG